MIGGKTRRGEALTGFLEAIDRPRPQRNGIPEPTTAAGAPPADTMLRVLRSLQAQSPQGVPQLMQSSGLPLDSFYITFKTLLDLRFVEQETREGQDWAKLTELGLRVAEEPS